MRVLHFIFICLLVALPARAGDWIKASITITNGTTNGMTITIKGSTRTWTNNVVTPSSHILTNSTAAGAGTNLFNHFGTYKVSGVLQSRSSPTNFVYEGDSLTASVSAGWATLTLTTNTSATNQQFFPIPLSVLNSTNRTNVATQAAADLGLYSSNSFSMHSILISNLMRLATNNNVTGSNVFSGTNLFSNISNKFYGTFSGIVGDLTNGSFTTPYFVGNLIYRTNSGVTTNLIQSGGAYRNVYEIAGSQVYKETVTTDDYTVSGGLNFVRFRISDGSATHTATNHVFNLGPVAANAGFTSTTGAFSGNLSTEGVFTSTLGGSNMLFTGTNNFRGDLAFQVTNNTALANGNNAALDFSGKIYSRISGPSAAFNINGIAGGRDGRLLILQNISGQSVTVANDSGVDPTAANRILTGTASDVTFTNASQPIWLLYDPTQSRWILQNMVGSATVGVNSLSNLANFGVWFQTAGGIAQLRGITNGNAGVSVSTNGTNIVISGPVFNNNQFQSGAGGTTNLKSGVTLTNLQASGTSDFGGTINGTTIVVNEIQTAALNGNGGAITIGSTLESTADASFESTLLAKAFVSAKTANYTVDINDSLKFFTNEGTTAMRTNTLPTAIANLIYTFIVQDGDGVAITADAGDTIRRAGTVSAAGGTITSTTIGSTITLVCINATEWVATSIEGTWSP